jgi:DNA mismatch endonuclease (patch repair protein)
MKQFYIRDGRAPLPEKESTSKVMSANKAKNTRPEIALRRRLWKEGIRGYRLNWKKAPGRPDIAFPSRKVAVFVNGCYWHRCPHCHPSFPRTHKDFWELKFSNNIRRDKQKIAQLEQMGWKVLTIWECELKKEINRAVDRVKEIVTVDIRS